MRIRVRLILGQKKRNQVWLIHHILILVATGPFTEFYQINLSFKRHQTTVVTEEMCVKTSPMQIKSLPCMKVFALTILSIVDIN